VASVSGPLSLALTVADAIVTVARPAPLNARNVEFDASLFPLRQVFVVVELIGINVVVRIEVVVDVRDYIACLRYFPQDSEHVRAAGSAVLQRA
jgi:hypothetical protein